MAKKLNYNRFLYGLIPGIILPTLFVWAYIGRFYPVDLPFYKVVYGLFPSVMLGKILLLSIIPNLVAVFIFYKQDSFKIAIGIMVGAIPYLISSMFML